MAWLKEVKIKSEKDMHVGTITKVCKECVKRINVEKPKSMIISTTPKEFKAKIQVEDVKQVPSFKYLGSCIRENKRCTQDIKIRITVGKETFHRRKNNYLQQIRVLRK